MPTDDEIARVKTNLSRLQKINDQIYNYGNGKIMNAFALLTQKDDHDLGLQIGLNLLCGAFWAAGGEFGPLGAVAANFMSGLISGYAVSTPPSLNQTFSTIIDRFQTTSITADTDLATLYSDPVPNWNKVYSGTFSTPFGSHTVSGTLAELSTVDVPEETDPNFETIVTKGVYGLDQEMWSILLTRFVVTTFSPNEELYQSHIPDINAWAQDYYNAHKSYWCTWVYYTRSNKPNKNHWDTTDHNLGTGASAFSDGSLNDNACNYLFIDSTDGTVINSNGLFARTFVFTGLNIPQKTHNYA